MVYSKCMAGGCPPISGAKLRIGGGICSSIKPCPGIELSGAVQDLESFYSGCTLAINPVQVGSGLKIKTIEAMGWGMPLVTTSAGASGLEGEAGKSFVLAEDPATFARAICDLLNSPTKARQLSESTLNFVKGWNARCRRAFAEAIGLNGK